MFVKFSCGCVGLIGVQGLKEHEHVIVSFCDGESSRDYGFHPREMMDPKRGGGWEPKSYEPLSDEEAGKLVQEISCLMANGHQMRQVRALLRE